MSGARVREGVSSEQGRLSAGAFGGGVTVFLLLLLLAVVMVVC